MEVTPLNPSEKKLIRQLHHKKHRDAKSRFIVAGARSIQELAKSDYRIEMLITTKNTLEQRPYFSSISPKIRITTPQVLAQISPLTHHQDMVAIGIYKPTASIPSLPTARHLILDHMQNPQNLGALLRLADWYGIPYIVCSPTSVDRYNPKSIQASMGSFARVEVYYTPLSDYLEQLDMPIIGAVLKGPSLHDHPLPHKGALIIGNEGQGISAALYRYITHPITIPKYGQAESLNVAVAAGILTDRWFSTRI